MLTDTKAKKKCAFLFQLAEAEFVGSSLLKERLGSGGDDQIFFFFTERNQEYSGTYSHSRVARVGRVCKVSADRDARREG